MSRDYSRYLRSEEWKQRRYAKLRSAGFRCGDCGSDGLGRLEVHHLTYARLGREYPEDLIVLCRLCHATRHGKVKLQDRMRAAVAINRELVIQEQAGRP